LSLPQRFHTTAQREGTCRCRFHAQAVVREAAEADARRITASRRPVREAQRYPQSPTPHPPSRHEGG
jgi:hypothetical protein